MHPAESLRRNQERIRAIFSRYDVSNPRLFGSAARGEDDEKSDIDIFVDPGKGVSFYDLADLQAELETLLGCKVDLATPGALPPDVRARVEQDLKALF